jgi:hypothetical protein
MKSNPHLPDKDGWSHPLEILVSYKHFHYLQKYKEKTGGMILLVQSEVLSMFSSPWSLLWLYIQDHPNAGVHRRDIILHPSQKGMDPPEIYVAWASKDLSMETSK